MSAVMSCEFDFAGSQRCSLESFHYGLINRYLFSRLCFGNIIAFGLGGWWILEADWDLLFGWGEVNACSWSQCRIFVEARAW